MADSVTFVLADGAGLDEPGAYDAGFVFETLHDMPKPVEVLDALRRAVRDDGAVVVMDEAVGEHLVADSDEVDRLMYGYSMTICLPDGLSSADSVGTGTVMRQSTLESYGVGAGFRRVEVLPIDGLSFFRFYRLVA